MLYIQARDARKTLLVTFKVIFTLEYLVRTERDRPNPCFVKTFSMSDGRFTGLLQTKKIYVCAAYGGAGDHSDGPMAGLIFLDPYLRGLLPFLGVKNF